MLQYIGNALSANQSTRYAFGGDWNSADVITVTINGKVVTLQAGSDVTAEVVAAVRLALGTENDADFAGINWIVDGDELVANSSDSEFDIRNNVQKVVIENVANPFVRIEVEGINVSQGIPEGQDVVQDFALAVGNVSDLELVN